MKISRILAITLAALMLVLCVASCGKTKAINVELKINAGDDGIIFETDVALDANKATVLNALIDGCDSSKIYNNNYTLNDEGNKIESIDTYKSYTDADTGIRYYWTYTVNGEEAKSGSAADNNVKQGDVIEYIYVAFDPAA